MRLMLVNDILLEVPNDIYDCAEGTFIKVERDLIWIGSYPAEPHDSNWVITFDITTSRPGIYDLKLYKMIEDISNWLALRLVGKYEEAAIKYVVIANGIPIQCNEEESDLEIYTIGKRLIRVRTDFTQITGNEIFCDREFLNLPFGIYEINLFKDDSKMSRVKDSYSLTFSKKNYSEVTLDKKFIKNLFL